MYKGSVASTKFKKKSQRVQNLLERDRHTDITS
jgi:hypothetical protein